MALEKSFSQPTRRCHNFIDAYPTAVELRIGLVETKLVYKQEIGEQVNDHTTPGNAENLGRTWSY